LNVLIVHDRRSAGTAAVDHLRAAGMRVRAVPLEERTLDQIHTHRPDVVLLAVTEAVSAACSVARSLLRMRERPGIVFLTSHEGAAELCLADDFVHPGGDPDDLALRLEVLAARRSLPAATTLEAGRVCIDGDARQVRVDGRPVNLTLTEFELLSLLARNAGRVVTKHVILDRVWRCGFDGESNIVETFISTLRRKLADTDRSLIRTVRGMGYLLAAEQPRRPPSTESVDPHSRPTSPKFYGCDFRSIS
jgi:two-component system OmpR family response regulator